MLLKPIPKDTFVYEIYEGMKGLSGDDLLNYLKPFGDHEPFRMITMMGFSKNVRPMLPPGITPYTPSEAEDTPQNLWSFIRNFGNFVVCAESARLKMLQIETMWIKMMEAIPAKEAAIVDLAKDKKLHENFDFETEEFLNLVKMWVPNPIEIITEDAAKNELES